MAPNGAIEAASLVTAAGKEARLVPALMGVPAGKAPGGTNTFIEFTCGNICGSVSVFPDAAIVPVESGPWDGDGVDPSPR